MSNIERDPAEFWLRIVPAEGVTQDEVIAAMDDVPAEVYVESSPTQGAVEALQHVVWAAEHPSPTVNTAGYLARHAREWLKAHGYPTAEGQ